jgi:hypothetical protein
MAIKSPLFYRKQAGGGWLISDESYTTGNIWFVDSGNTSNGADSAGFGQHPDAPFLTIDYAVAKCTASNGDLIIAMPGHAEVVTEAGGLDLDVVGITIRGIGSGADQPTITYTTVDTADVDIDAANVTIENIHFVAGIADVAAAIDVNCADFTIRNCRLTGDNGGLNALVWIQDAATTGSHRITVENCYCMDRDASNTHFINFSGTGDGHIIRNNALMGDFGTVCIGGAGEITNCTISHNLISNAATTADSGVGLAAAATGIVMHNSIGIALAGDATTGVTAAACALVENYVVDTGADRQGVLDPAATT